MYIELYSIANKTFSHNYHEIKHILRQNKVNGILNVRLHLWESCTKIRQLFISYLPYCYAYFIKQYKSIYLYYFKS